MTTSPQDNTLASNNLNNDNTINASNHNMNDKANANDVVNHREAKGMTAKRIRTRFAPSPTGFLHIGGARTALFAWAFARKNNGSFVLRVEDTDLKRSTWQSVESILDALKWLNLDYDEGPIYQTDRLARYQEVIDHLIKQGHAYYCYCTQDELNELRQDKERQGEKPKYDRRCLLNPNPQKISSNRNPVVRFKNPEHGIVSWHDLTRGMINIDNKELDDLIIRRSDGSPTYNLCVVVDDIDMQITHVIRGDDHINNTPRQLNIMYALNATPPLYAHLPMILRSDGQKMSKRHDAVSVMDYQKMGILPQALLNYLARLCFGYKDHEIFTIEEFIAWFALDRISSSPARFDLQKLIWVNTEHIKNSSGEALAKLVAPSLRALLDNPNDFEKVLDLPVILEGLKSRVSDINELIAECHYFYKPLAIGHTDQETYLTVAAKQVVQDFLATLNQLPLWQLPAIKQCIQDFCRHQSIKMSQLAMPLRLMLCGTTKTPSLDWLLLVLGRDLVNTRLTPHLL